MNKRNSLLITLEIFDYCAMHSCEKKAAVEALGYSGMVYDCALCAWVGYDGWNSREYCKNCPIDWPILINANRTPCEKSHYWLWERASTWKESAPRANIIANLALNALNKEWPEEL